MAQGYFPPVYTYPPVYTGKTQRQLYPIGNYETNLHDLDSSLQTLIDLLDDYKENQEASINQRDPNYMNIQMHITRLVEIEKILFQENIANILIDGLITSAKIPPPTIQIRNIMIRKILQMIEQNPDTDDIDIITYIRNYMDTQNITGQRGAGLRRGRAISAPQAKKLLQSSYKKDPDVKIGDWELDESISRPTARVYYNPVIQQGAVVHRGTEGTVSDWSNNLQYIMGTNKLTNRYKEAEMVQKKAEAKYSNLLTLSHSQGGIYGKIARDQSKVINVNPASMGETTSGTTIRSANDPVSMLAGLTGLFKKNPKNITTSAQLNPLKAHSLDILDEIDPNRMLGEGLRRMKRSKVYKVKGIVMKRV